MSSHRHSRRTRPRCRIILSLYFLPIENARVLGADHCRTLPVDVLPCYALILHLRICFAGRVPRVAVPGEVHDGRGFVLFLGLWGSGGSV
jgi:hypothetical protein